MRPSAERLQQLREQAGLSFARGSIARELFAEIDALTEELKEARAQLQQAQEAQREIDSENHELRLACEARADERDVEMERSKALEAQLRKLSAVSDEVLDNMIYELDAFAREKDHYDYGLPCDAETGMPAMRELMRKVWKEALGLSASPAQQEQG